MIKAKKSEGIVRVEMEGKGAEIILELSNIIKAFYLQTRKSISREQTITLLLHIVEAATTDIEKHSQK